MRALLCTVLVLASLVDTAPRAVELDLTPARMQAALAVARGPESARAAFHKPYTLPGNNPTVDSIEIITEYRRIVKIAEAKIADGNPLEFKIMQTILPEIKLPDYRKIAIQTLGVEGAQTPSVDRDKRRGMIIDAILKETRIPLPAIIVERELENMVGEIKSRYGSKASEVELRAELRPITEGRVRVGLLVESIAKAEKIEPQKVLDFLESLP